MKEFTVHWDELQTAAAWELGQKQREAPYYALYVGMDVHKDSIAIAVAWAHRGDPDYRGEIANQPKSVTKLVRRLSEECEGGVILFCYEAGPCGYGLYRQIIETGRD